MGVLDITDQGSAPNPRAPGVMSYGREGVPPGFQVDTEGNMALLGSLSVAGGLPGGVVVTRGIVTTGDITLPNTAAAWLPVTGLSFLIPAEVGDNIEFQAAFMFAPTSTSFVEFAVSTGGALVRYSSTRGASPSVEGDPTMYNTPGTYRGQGGGSFDFTVEAGDLTAGNVNIVLASNSQGSGVVYASANFPFRWNCKNYGPGS